jgi:hypothetical protein
LSATPSSNGNQNRTGPAGPYDADVPLRSRSGGVNRPRAAVPTPLLAADAARLVDAAHTKRARMVTAIGVPAVFLAATGVSVIPTVANAASASSNPSSSTTCAPGSAAVANSGAKTAAGGTSSSAPSSAPSKAGATSSAPSSPKPSSSATTQQQAPAPQPSGAPSGTSAPVKPSPTSVPSGTTAPPSSSSTSAAPKASSTPSPTSTVTWWNPLTWLGTTVNQVFNPAPSSSSSTVNTTVNKLAAAPAATPSSSPSSTPAPILSIGLGGSSSSSAPSSAPSTPQPGTPQPTSSGSSGSTAPSTPSAPSSSAPSSGASTPSGAPSTVQIGGQTITVPPPSTTVCVAAADSTALREVEWHLDASSLTLYGQKFLGFQQIQTGDGRTVTVMAIHADSIDLVDMVTYNEDGKPRVYSDGGKGKTVHLTNVTLHVLQQKGSLVAPLPIGPVTLGPPGEAGTDLASQLLMALLPLNLPFPEVFTNVSVDQYLLTSDTLDVPGFNVKSAS